MIYKSNRNRFLPLFHHGIQDDTDLLLIMMADVFTKNPTLLLLMLKAVCKILICICQHSFSHTLVDIYVYTLFLKIYSCSKLTFKLLIFIQIKMNINRCTVCSKVCRKISFAYSILRIAALMPNTYILAMNLTFKTPLLTVALNNITSNCCKKSCSIKNKSLVMKKITQFC